MIFEAHSLCQKAVFLALERQVLLLSHSTWSPLPPLPWEVYFLTFCFPIKLCSYFAKKQRNKAQYFPNIPEQSHTRVWMSASSHTQYSCVLTLRLTPYPTTGQSQEGTWVQPSERSGIQLLTGKTEAQSATAVAPKPLPGHHKSIGYTP